MAADQTMATEGRQAAGDHWALQQLLDRDRRRHSSLEAIPLGRLHAQIARSTSAADLADRLGVSAEVLQDRLRTLDDEETWQLTAHVAFTEPDDGDRG